MCLCRIRFFGNLLFLQKEFFLVDNIKPEQYLIIRNSSRRQRIKVKDNLETVRVKGLPKW